MNKRKIKIINDFIDGKINLDFLVDTILRLEAELEIVKRQKKPIKYKLVRKVVWGTQIGVVCHFMLIDEKLGNPSTQLRLKRIPTVGERISLNINKELFGVFKVEEVVNDINLNKDKKEINQEVFIYISR